MANEPFVGDRLGKRDLILATLAGLVFGFIYSVFSSPGLDPALWDDLTVASGLRPPRTVFPGLWRLGTEMLIGAVGMERLPSVLRLVGSVCGGLSVALVYLVVRQSLAFLCRVKDLSRWVWIAPLYAMLAAAAFGAGDTMWRVVSPFTPGGLRLLALLFSLHVFLCWLKSAGLWRILLAMFVFGALAAESPFGFLMPLVCYILYRLLIAAAVDEQIQLEGRLPQLMMLPRWRMFFAFLCGLIVFAGLNVWTFIAHGGLDANGWGGLDLVFRYVLGYYALVISAASPVGWLLSITFCVLPLIVALVLMPMLSRDNEPLRFKLGLIMFFAGVLALVQCGILPYTRLWSYSTGAVEVRSDFLECFFALCTVITMAMASACFTQGCQFVYDYDADDGDFRPVDTRGPFMRCLVQVVVILCLLPVVMRIRRPAEAELRAIVQDALAETIRECGDAKYVFTDGRLDDGLELTAARLGSKVRPLNMMSGASAWETYIRTRGFDVDSPDYESIQTGVPVLLRVWAGERANGMDESAVQLGFEFWRRARKPLPRQSGLVARSKGMDEAEANRGVEAARKLAVRIVEAAKRYPHAAVSPALRSAVSSVSWRISRFARMRDEETLANELDEWNETVKHMMDLISYERSRTFMQMTPYEGLRLALRRADFAEARRYGAPVLQMDPEDPEANFGTGMAFLMEDKLKEAEFYLERTLKRRPEEPAVLNNLSIIYRKTNRLDKALEFVRRAIELAPGNDEIERTLRDTERAATNRANVLKSAFSR